MGLRKRFLKTVASAMAACLLLGNVAVAEAAKPVTIKDVFDANYYATTYKDVKEAFGKDEKALYQHYLDFGQEEERTFSSLIDVVKYRAAYADLDKAFGDNWDAYVNHYIEFGFQENRESFGTFDARAYADRYPDLKAAFGYDVLKLYKHYITFGIKEGRNASADVRNSAGRNTAGSGSAGSGSSGSGSNGGTNPSGTPAAPVTTMGRLVDPETGNPIPNATLTFTRTSDVFQAHAQTVSGGEVVESGEDYYIVTTDGEGYYEIPEFKPGVYEVEVEAPGYMNLKLNSISVESDTASFTMPTFELLSVDTSGSNTVSGNAIDAVTGDTLSNVLIKVRSGWNTYEGAVIASTTTDNDGGYAIDLERGYYTLEFICEGYVPFYVNIACSNALRSPQGILVPSVSEVSDEEFRIVLTWGEIPRDLDSHLVGPARSPENPGACFHVCYYNKSYWCKNQADNSFDKVASLDIDDTTSYGPETVTIVEARSDEVYFYSVHDYTNGGDSTSTEMSASGANVKVYKGATLVKEYHVPLNRTGYVWNVFKIVNNEIVTINNYNSDYDTMYGTYAEDDVIEDEYYDPDSDYD